MLANRPPLASPGKPFASKLAPTQSTKKKARHMAGLFMAREEGSDLAHELRLQLHRADAVDLAVDVVVAVDEADVLNARADLHDER